MKIQLEFVGQFSSFHWLTNYKAMIDLTDVIMVTYCADFNMNSCVSTLKSIGKGMCLH